jgi:hypothetical protein
MSRTERVRDVAETIYALVWGDWVRREQLKEIDVTGSYYCDY